MSQRDDFERVWHLLAAAVERYGKTHSKADVWDAIASQKAQLHPLPHSAMVTSIETFPSGMKELRGWLAGGDLNEIVKYVPLIEDWASKDMGCHRASIVGRRGWLRAFEGYEDRGTILVKDFT